MEDNVPLQVVVAITGHEYDSMAYGRYGKDYKVGVMFDAIKQVKYGIDHSRSIDNKLNLAYD